MMGSDERSGTSRRDVLSAAALGLAASASPAFGKDQEGAKASTSASTADYPKPPFARQSQAWPGLASRMVPRPDHGESSYKGSNRLMGRKALITGGDSGIGRAAAIAFAREGADVAIGYLPSEQSDADEVAALIRQSGRKAVLLPGDIREPAFCRKLVMDAVSGFGGLDILVNNAARQVSRNSILEIEEQDFDDTFKTNIYANFWITKAAVPHLGPGSAIINTTSVNAYDPGENIIDYAATKGAIMIWTKGLAKQLAGRGIRVNGVAPGPFWTPLQVTGGQTQDKLVAFGKDSPLGRPGQPAELAAIYVALADPMLSYTTGQIFGATGGHGGP